MRIYRSIVAGALGAVLALAACEAPTGPRGEPGPEGPQGPQGPQGPPGVDLIQQCSDCHASDQALVVIQQLFDSSPHGFGTFEVRGPDYAGGSCISCHTSQGFVAAATGGDPDFSGGVASMSCRTCHQIHVDYESDGFALTTTEPVELMISQTTVDFGAGNLCVNCHQGRVPDPIPTVGAGGQDTVPARYGTHHGPQGTVFAAGPGLPVFDGDASLPTEPLREHTTFSGTENVSCVGCHMQAVVGNDVGGHTWGMLSGGEVNNDGTCDACHVDVTSAYNEVSGIVQPLLDDLEACLLAEGVIDGNGDPNVGAVVDNDLLAAHLIWQTLSEDGSLGAHHPEYVPAILSNTNDYLDANYASCAP